MSHLPFEKTISKSEVNVIAYNLKALYFSVASTESLGVTESMIFMEAEQPCFENWKFLGNLLWLLNLWIIQFLISSSILLKDSLTT